MLRCEAAAICDGLVIWRVRLRHGLVDHHACVSHLGEVCLTLATGWALTGATDCELVVTAIVAPFEPSAGRPADIADVADVASALAEMIEALEAPVVYDDEEPGDPGAACDEFVLLGADRCAVCDHPARDHVRLAPPPTTWDDRRHRWLYWDGDAGAWCEDYGLSRRVGWDDLDEHMRARVRDAAATRAAPLS